MPLDLNLAALYMRVGDQYVPIPGVRGEPGVSPTVAVTDITGGHRVTITDASGSNSFDVLDGTDGSTPVLTVIHITGSSPNYVSDVTFEEAMTAYTNGALLYATMAGSVFCLERVETNRLIFSYTGVNNSSSVSSRHVWLNSSGRVSMDNWVINKREIVRFDLTSNGSDAYADPPTGTLGVVSSVDDISYAYAAAAGASDGYIMFGLCNGAVNAASPGPYEIYTVQSATWDEETGPETVVTLTFRCLGFRNGVPVVKTITVSDTPWTYDSFGNAAVSYSETALAVAP